MLVGPTESRSSAPFPSFESLCWRSWSSIVDNMFGSAGAGSGWQQTDALDRLFRADVVDLLLLLHRLLVARTTTTVIKSHHRSTGTGAQGFHHHLRPSLLNVNVTLLVIFLILWKCRQMEPYFSTSKIESVRRATGSGISRNATVYHDRYPLLPNVSRHHAALSCAVLCGCASWCRKAASRCRAVTSRSISIRYLSVVAARASGGLPKSGDAFAGRFDPVEQDRCLVCEG